MSVNWKDESSKARIHALAAAEQSGEFDHTVPTWDVYCDLREALIWALLITGFPPRSDWAITDKNWNEVYCRLHVLETVNGCYRRYNNGAENPTRDIWFTPEEVESMVGLSVNAGNKSATEFRKYIMDQLIDRSKTKLDSHINPTESAIADPYWFERAKMERAL
jgi:hypothetical protein